MNILTFDIEEWFHILDHDSTKSEKNWSNYEYRIEENMDRIFDLLDKHNQDATFFCLGWVAEKFPNIIRKFRYPISFWLRIIFASATQTYISTDRGEFNGSAFNISVCNAQYFGGGWNISPKSSLQDGLFNAQIFAVTKLKAMKIFFLAKKGLHLKESSVLVKRTSNIKLMTNQAIEIDGDYFGQGPAEIFIKKRAIRFKI